MTEGIIALTSESEFADKVEKSTVPTVVDLWAPGCGPCIMQTKVLEELVSKHGEKVQVLKVNVDEVPAVAQQFQVQAIPTLLFFDEGTHKDTHVGLISVEALEKKLDL